MAKYAELLQLVKSHKKGTQEFMFYQQTTSWIDAWFELLYCILAGTQVSTEIVKKAFLNLINKNPTKLTFYYIYLHPEIKEEYIKPILKLSGYRFYNIKSRVIIDAATCFVDIISEYKKIDNIDAEDVRTKLINNVKGIGYKISAHWLRNIGFDLPIIDIHVRRVLSCADAIDKKYNRYGITNKDYLYIEKKTKDLSNAMGIKSSFLDYALWTHGREFCTHKNCYNCPLTSNIHGQ